MPDPPVAPRRPSTRDRHGVRDHDDLAWMRDHADPALRTLLEAENDYADAVLAPGHALRKQVFGEIKARTLETDLSVPHRKDGWWYLTRTEEGKSYAIHCRRPASPGYEATAHPDEPHPDEPHPDDPHPDEVVILDENVLAAGHDHLAVGVAHVSPDGRLLAYSVDFAGAEAYELRIRDLDTGEDRAEAIPGTSYGFAWAADSRTLFYTTLDEAQRPWRVHRHLLGADAADGSDDALVLQEDDERFWVGLGASRSGDLVAIDIGSAVTSEIQLIDAHEPTTAPRVVVPRRQGIEASIAHHGCWLYVTSNEDALDFALWRAPLADPERSRWTPVLPHRPGTRLLGAEAFAGHLVVHLRTEGRPGLRVLDTAVLDARSDDTGALDPAVVAAASRDIELPDASYGLGGAANEEWDTTRYRFTYQSLITPTTVFEDDLASGERCELKRQPVLGDFTSTDYETERTWATAADGTEVPVSLSWRRGVPRDGTAPCVLYGYGAYEMSMDPWFSIARLSLLDRGVVFALAHVRGGGEMGRQWYEDGKLLAKPNSFGDLVAAATHLVDERWVAPDRIALRGGSAGGLLVGAATNLAPDRFRAVVAEVPFVDALTTILDPTLPLTVVEWEEWGNPVDSADVFRTMRSYTPTENITGARYPAVLATGGLNDPRVGVHEPSKWVQRLRERTETDPDRPVVFRVELGAGHGGPSGRYDAWRHEAEILVFLLDQLDAVDRS